MRTLSTVQNIGFESRENKNMTQTSTSAARKVRRAPWGRLSTLAPALAVVFALFHTLAATAQSVRAPSGREAAAVTASTMSATPAATDATGDLGGLLASRPAILAGQSATQLADGRWLILGGAKAGSAGNQAWLIDAAGKSSLLPASLFGARMRHSASVLPDGSVLVFGGVDARGNTLSDSEKFDPAQNTFIRLPSLGLIARSDHTATVLTDGRLLIAGGVGADGSALRTVELYDPQTNQIERVNTALDGARMRHVAALLPSGKVLLWGGIDGASERESAGAGARAKSSRGNGNLYDPATQQFSPLAIEGAQPLAQSLNAGGAPSLLTSTPTSDARDVPVAQRLVLRFSQRMAVASLNGSTVTLLGPSGPVAVQSVAVEGGVLLFVTPRQELLPATAYTLFVQGATDQFGQALPLTAIGFRTARLGAQAGAGKQPVRSVAQAVFAATPAVASEAAGGIGAATAGAVQTAAGGIATPKTPAVANAALAATTQVAVEADEDDDVWVPGVNSFRGQFGGQWRRGNREVSKQHRPKNSRLRRTLYGYPELMKLTPADVAERRIPDVTPPPDGVTGVAGQVLRLNGRPLEGATLSIGAQKVVTDDNGEFLLAGVPSGRQVLVIDGETAGRGNRHYGRYEYGVKIEDGKTTMLPFVIWMSRLNPRTVTIPSPTTDDLVVTNPQIPGMELRIPAGVVIRDAQGKIVTQISMTAIPVNQPPFPLPHIEVPVYFTIQPGGSRLEGLNANAKGAQLIYPNYPNAAPGTRMTFWDYDALNRGWFEYGHGTVTADGKQVMPDADVRIYEFSGAMITTFTPESQAPPVGPPPNCQCDTNAGDPVDTSTGLFLNKETDLVIPDVMPISIGRTYRQADQTSRAFGIGTNLSYDLFLVGGYDTARDLIKPYAYLILPDGGRIYFKRVSGGTGYTNAVFQSVAAPGSVYYGAIIKWDNQSYPGADWSLLLKNGSAYYFPGTGDGGGSARSSAVVGIKDRLGNTMQLIRSNYASSPGSSTPQNFGNLTQIISPNGRNVYLSYDAANRVTQIKDDLQRTVSYTYDAQGRLTQVTDPLGKTMQYTWATQTVPAANSIGGLTSSTNMLTVVDKNGNTMVTNVYDANGRVSKQTYADGQTYTFAYTLLSASQSIPAGSFDAVKQTDATNERGTVTRYVFNANQAPTSVTVGQGTPIAQTTTYSWNATTNLLDSVTDALGRITTYQYDSLGNVTQATVASGTSNAATTKLAWDRNFARPTTVTDANNNKTTLSYDSLGNLTQSTDALNHSTTLVYDNQGRPTSVADALSNTTTLSYSGADLQSVRDPLGNTVTRYTDAGGRTTSQTDALDKRSYRVYDGLNRITSLTNSRGGVVQVSYDGNGNVLTQVDEKNNTTRYVYDGRNRPTKITDALDHNATIAYESGGRESKVTDNKGQITSTSYDALGRPTEIGYGATAGNSTPASTVTLTWDAGNRLTKIVDSVGGTITREYDDLNRLTKEITSQGSIGYTYDAAGRRKSTTVAGQPQLSYTWDAANRLTQIQQAAGSTNGNAIQTVGFDYDNADRRTKVTYPNGIVASYGWDKANRLTDISYKKADGTLVGDLTYTYDANGQRTGMGGSLARVDAGTPVSTTQFNVGNQLTKWGEQTLTYDANGNLTSDGQNTYVWDERNQLKSISGAIMASFQYDAFGRRTGKTIGTSSTGYLYDGGNFVQEKSGSGSGASVTANLISGPSLDELYQRQTAAGNQSMLTDALGSVLMATDGSQANVASYSYDAYGKTTQTGTGDNSQQYTGRENDQTGLYYYRARYYNPAWGRFISEDPIGWSSGQTNGFAYVDANPMSYVDPSGLKGYMSPFDLRSPLVYDNGSSCKLVSPGSQIDENGCISTGGGPSICLGPGSLRGGGLGSLTKEELKALIGPEQTKLLRELFGSGMKGAEKAAENLSRPAGLTDQALGAYKELANRALGEYEQAGKAAGAALQRARLELLRRLGQ